MTFKVHTIPHTFFAAQILTLQLQRLGHNASLVDTIEPGDQATYIIYGANRLRSLPQNYIVYQTEILGSHHFTPQYHRIIARARAVWDYSVVNQSAYHHPRKSIVTPGVRPMGCQLFHKNQDILFYGWIDGSMRRIEKVAHIARHIPLKIYTDLTHPAIWRVLGRSRTVINLHYYDHSPLEVFRINEALSHGCAVISEGYDERYKNLVHFANDTKDMIHLSKHVLPENKDLSILDNLEEIRNAVAIL